MIRPSDSLNFSTFSYSIILFTHSHWNVTCCCRRVCHFVGCKTDFSTIHTNPLLCVNQLILSSPRFRKSEWPTTIWRLFVVCHLVLKYIELSLFLLRCLLYYLMFCYRGRPAVTNCDATWNNTRCQLCLDYLWFNPHSLDVSSALRTPSTESICRHYAIPNALFPSDHIPLKARFTFSQTDTGWYWF